jgi:hypothetical protein
MNMNRRNFLTGAITTTAAGLLIRADEPLVQAFAPVLDEPAMLTRMPPPVNPNFFIYGMEVYSKEGHFLGHVRDVSIHREMHDATSWGGPRTAVPGLSWFEFLVVSTGNMDWLAKTVRGLDPINPHKRFDR